MLEILFEKKALWTDFQIFAHKAQVLSWALSMKYTFDGYVLKLLGTIFCPYPI